jgi:GntR family transcriptional repressor for pyruvate dehydrogenase complex
MGNAIVQMTNLMLLPKKKQRLGDLLYGQILDQIVSGALTEGERLPSENKICQSFQVSRPIVREALMRLAADGLVVSRQGSGTFVQRRPPSGLTRFAEVADVAGMLRCLEVRMALEGQSAALAARRRTADQLREIARALEDMRDGFAIGAVPSAADAAFHLAVARASGNELFADLLGVLRTTIEQSMNVALSITREGSKERANRVWEEHRAVFEAIAQGDSQAADLAMRYHLDRSRQRVTDGQRDA